MNKLLQAVIFVVLLVVLRLLPHLPNFFPLTAIALFSGAFISLWDDNKEKELNKKSSLKVSSANNNTITNSALLISGVFFSDILLGFHESQVIVYLALIFTVWLGSNTSRDDTDKINPANYISRSLFGSLVFFVLTNLSVWGFSSMYEKTFAGLIKCFTLAVPFFERTIFADTLFSAVIVFVFCVLNLSSTRFSMIQSALGRKKIRV